MLTGILCVFELYGQRGCSKRDMMSLQDFVDSTLIFLHVLLPPREAATTLHLSGTLAGALGEHTAISLLFYNQQLCTRTPI